MAKQLTIVLQNYRRPGNIPRILDALAAQTVPHELFVWDNSPDHSFRDARADWVCWSTVNCFCAGRYWMMAQARTRWVAGLDDDLAPSDTRALEYLLDAFARYPGRVVGASGVRLEPGASYQYGRHYGCDRGSRHTLQDEPVHVVKGRLLAAATEGFRWVVPLASHLDGLPTENDIRVSSHFGGGVVVHKLAQAFKNLRTGNESICHRDNHWQMREAARARFFPATL